MLNIILLILFSVILLYDAKIIEGQSASLTVSSYLPNFLNEALLIFVNKTDEDISANTLTDIFESKGLFSNNLKRDPDITKICIDNKKTINEINHSDYICVPSDENTDVSACTTASSTTSGRINLKECLIPPSGDSGCKIKLKDDLSPQLGILIDEINPYLNTILEGKVAINDDDSGDSNSILNKTYDMDLFGIDLELDFGTIGPEQHEIVGLHNINIDNTVGASTSYNICDAVSVLYDSKNDTIHRDMISKLLGNCLDKDSQIFQNCPHSCYKVLTNKDPENLMHDCVGTLQSEDECNLVPQESYKKYINRNGQYFNCALNIDGDIDDANAGNIWEKLHYKEMMCKPEKCNGSYKPNENVPEENCNGYTITGIEFHNNNWDNSSGTCISKPEECLPPSDLPDLMTCHEEENINEINPENINSITTLF